MPKGYIVTLSNISDDKMSYVTKELMKLQRYGGFKVDVHYDWDEDKPFVTTSTKVQKQRTGPTTFRYSNDGKKVGINGETALDAIMRTASNQEIVTTTELKNQFKQENRAKTSVASAITTLVRRKLLAKVSIGTYRKMEVKNSNGG
jgi:hypothetical protein